MDTQILLLIVLIILSGFFSGVETALMSISDVKVRQLYEKKKKGSIALKSLKEHPHRLIITLLLGNNIVNIGASAIATSLAISYWGNVGVGIATGAMTLIILIFGEICPKGVAVKNSEKISLKVAGLILFLKKILFPVVFILDIITKQMTKLFTPKDDEGEPLVTEEELRDIVMIGEKEGSINEHEKTMIDNIFELNDTVASEIMTPRTDMFALDSKLAVSGIVEKVIKEGFSRIPIYDKSTDNIIGRVSLSQLFETVYQKKDLKLKKLVKPILFIPETKKVDELMREFQRKKEHMAVVVDEFGGVSGIITMEDLVEEIVGEIYDEDEKEDLPPIRKLRKNEYIIQGDTEVEDVEKAVKINLDYSENINSIGGYILEQLGRIPKKGDSVSVKHADFKVTKMSKHRIREVKLVRT